MLFLKTNVILYLQYHHNVLDAQLSLRYSAFICGLLLYPEVLHQKFKAAQKARIDQQISDFLSLC